MHNLFISLLLFIQTSFYSLTIQDNNGNTISLDSFRGKKVLLVTIATGSPRVQQLSQLKQLQQQFSNLVILAFPSNSFGNENRSDADIRQFCTANYQTSFTIAKKDVVAGNNLQPVFSWLARQSDNGDMDAVVTGDFQKFLISPEGDIAGVFAPQVSPLDPVLIQALSNSQ